MQNLDPGITRVGHLHSHCNCSRIYIYSLKRVEASVYYFRLLLGHYVIIRSKYINE